MYSMDEKNVLELVEDRLKALTKAVRWQERVVTGHEERYAGAAPPRKELQGKLLRSSRLILEYDKGRQHEAESIWTLLKAHTEREERCK